MKHLTQEQRYTIWVLNKQGKSQKVIAEAIGVSQPTISKELHRNKNEHGHYVVSVAQELADWRKERYHNIRKFTIEMEQYIVDKIVLSGWSPEVIVNDARRQGVTIVSVERIYQFLRADKRAGGSVYRWLPHQLKHRQRPLTAGVGHIPNRTSIHDRPPDVELREEFGHWEMDLIQNKGGNSFILTLVERSTRFMMMTKLKNGKHADEVAKSVVALLFPYRKYVNTITTDNGGEFAHHEYITKRLKAKVYFADPYCSWQKGTIENTNKLVRQFIPKGSTFNKLTDNDILYIQKLLNQRPRKVLNFDTPTKSFFHLVG